MKRLPIYGKKTVKLALEFGVVLSRVASKEKIEMTTEIVARAEDIFINEVRTNGLTKTACQFVPLILAALEVKE
jgi:hypothetical protein